MTARTYANVKKGESKSMSSFKLSGTAKRLAAALLALIMVVGILPISAAAGPDEVELSVKEADKTPGLESYKQALANREEAPEPADDEVVRVSIVLEDPSAMDKGFSTIGIADNKPAMEYMAKLEKKQDEMADVISEKVLGKKMELDVVWNLTLVANIISANVEYGLIDEIKNVPGVKDVVIENTYAPAKTSTDNVPYMGPSSSMIGSPEAWAAGYKGAGSKVAIIDTGLDLDHEMFDETAFLYGFKDKGGYSDSLLMDADDVAEALKIEGLNANDGRTTASAIYKNAKVPFAYNYVGKNANVRHTENNTDDHGTHVAGIVAGNEYVRTDKGWAPSLTTKMTQGVAPLAQLLIMNVFSTGAKDSDYMAAIEDAMLLGADSANLSLGSVYPGFGKNEVYAEIMEKLVESDTVVCIAAGNAGSWADETMVGMLYGDDVGFDTAGSPGVYKNALAVASVENDGMTAEYLQVKDSNTLIFYNERTENSTTGAAYTNPPISSVAGEYPFVYLDSIAIITGDDGEVSENQIKKLDEAIDGGLKGKIVIANRGVSSFVLKLEAMADCGAVAGIIVDTEQVSSSVMDLSTYTKKMPAVLISGQYKTELTKGESGTIATDNDAGGNAGAAKVTYYTGTMTISDGVQSGSYNSSYYTMSSFSSWGIPGTLLMKPEITAPGGNIWSSWGASNSADGGHDKYVSYSGTSMATPQVAGMAAVIAQYIREHEAQFKSTGLTKRALINSLLMATAEPLKDADGNYYSVLQQGAGLANVAAAVKAQSYITMDEKATSSYADGKVKVELGDDPMKGGTYDYTFTIHNFSGKENAYILNSEFFTQALIDDSEESGYTFLDKATTPLTADVKYTVNGVEYGNPTLGAYDVDMDGDVDTDDAQAILDFVAGLLEETAIDKAAADVDGDDAVTTYDAHLLLAKLDAQVTVPANGELTVKVTFTLKGDLTAYEKGLYIEGFTFVKALSDEEGASDVTYSIPVLGYYGGWTEPSMFDRATVDDKINETAEYVPYTGVYSNEMVDYDGYYLSTNPYLDVPDLHIERKAVRSDLIFQGYAYSLIRNAYVMLIVQDGDGKIIDATVPELENAAFYYQNTSAWEDVEKILDYYAAPEDLGLSEDDTMTFTLAAIPEFMVGDDFDTLDENDQVEYVLDNVIMNLQPGALRSSTFTIDDTAPTSLHATMNKKTGDVTAKLFDNQYVAALILFDASSGYEELTRFAPEQDEAADTATVVIPGDVLKSHADKSGNVLALVVDYAGNESYWSIDTNAGKIVTPEVTRIDILDDEVTAYVGYKTTLDVEIESYLFGPEDLIWESDNEEVATVSNGVVTGVSVGTAKITATSPDNDKVYDTVTVTVEEPKVTSIDILDDEITVYIGYDAELDVDIEFHIFGPEDLIWESDNEEVAEVEDGIVYGLTAGTANITATSPDDPDVSDTVKVTVVKLDDLVASVATEDGQTWSSFDIENPKELHKITDGANKFTAGTTMPGPSIMGWAYATDGTGLYYVSPTEGFEEGVVLDDLIFTFSSKGDVNCVFSDADAGNLTGSFFTDTFVAFRKGTAEYMLFQFNLLSGQVGLSSYDFGANKGWSNIAGVAFCGSSSAQGADYYYCLGEDSTLYLLLATSTSIGSMTIGKVEGLDIADADSVSMVYDFVNRDVETLYVAYAVDGATKIAMITVDEDNNITLVSTDDFDGSVKSAVVLMQNDPTYSAPEAANLSASAAALAANLTATEQYTAEAEPLKANLPEIDAAAKTAIPDGTLQSVKVEKPDETKEESVVDTENNTVTVEVTAAGVANGLFTAEYDTSVLKLLSVTSSTAYYAVNDGTDGKVVFDFASASNVDGVVAVLVFEYAEEDENGLDTDVKITVSEDGDELEAETVDVVNAHVPASYEVKVDAKGGKAEAPETTVEGEDVVIKLTPDDGNKLPETVTVTVDGKTLESTEYKYENGTITIPADKVTGPVVVTVEFPKIPVSYEVEVDAKGGEAEAPETTVEGENVVINLKPGAGNKLPASVKVTVDGKELDSKDYTYDPETGKVTIPAEKVTGPVTVSVEFPKDDTPDTQKPDTQKPDDRPSANPGTTGDGTPIIPLAIMMTLSASAVCAMAVSNAKSKTRRRKEDEDK